jgi:hypothetical protein
MKRSDRTFMAHIGQRHLERRPQGLAPLAVLLLSWTLLHPSPVQAGEVGRDVWFGSRVVGFAGVTFLLAPLGESGVLAGGHLFFDFGAGTRWRGSGPRGLGLWGVFSGGPSIVHTYNEQRGGTNFLYALVEGGAVLAGTIDAGPGTVFVGGRLVGQFFPNVYGAAMRDRLASHVPVPAPLQTDAHRGDDPR